MMASVLKYDGSTGVLIDLDGAPDCAFQSSDITQGSIVAGSVVSYDASQNPRLSQYPQYPRAQNIKLWR